MAEDKREWFAYEPEFRANREKPQEARGTVEVHALSNAEAQAIRGKVLLIGRPRKGESDVRTAQRTADEITQLNRDTFLANVRNPKNLRTLGGRELTSAEDLWEYGDAALVAEITEAIEDASKLEAGLRDRLSS